MNVCFWILTALYAFTIGGVSLNDDINSSKLVDIFMMLVQYGLIIGVAYNF